MSTKYILAICLFLIELSLHTVESGHIIKLDQQTDFFEGDVRLPKTRNGILATQRWTNNTVYWQISETSRFNQTLLNMLAKAMKEIEDHTCIRFAPYTNQQNFIRVINRQGCSSDVGMVGNVQYVTLNDDPNGGSCWAHYIIVHELLHAIGLWHEQSRYDRDDFIKVNKTNIQPGMRYNFAITYQNESSTYGVPYNYLSIMHYSKYAFTSNNEATIETTDIGYSDLIGNTLTAAESDYEKVRRIYNCNGVYPAMPTPVISETKSKCEDTMQVCGLYLNECQTGWFHQTQCRKSCGFCSPDCKDKIDYCLQYSKECGKLDWLKEFCPKTCRFCTPY